MSLKVRLCHFLSNKSAFILSDAIFAQKTFLKFCPAGGGSAPTNLYPLFPPRCRFHPTTSTTILFSPGRFHQNHFVWFSSAPVPFSHFQLPCHFVPPGAVFSPTTL
ncbi:hypothetical protein T10_3655 [Trichinella papuae]|uniref:Uncharacterized protein n=1 Tax=Trichinella papuae TaxID=268474 RepID=A0A0V1M483_9BILA|nr:hypothetical protein T10_3655 [Trichinella papuae]